MSLSQLARSISESPTLKLNETAALLREKGEPVIHLGGGEPKSKAPIDAIINCTSLLNTGEVRYTAPDGIPALKKAVIRYTEEHYHKLVSADNVLVSGGAKQALMVLLHAILDPKEEVIFPAPYWVSYPEMVKLAGGVPVVVTAEDGTFYPTVREIADAVGSYTKAIILNSPNNPSGAMYSREFVAEMVEFCEKKSLYLIMDDIYNRLVFEWQERADLLRLCQDAARAIQAGGHQRCVEDLRHDGLPHRLGHCQPRVDGSDGEHPIAANLGPRGAFAMGGGGSAERRAILGGGLAHDAREQSQRHARPPGGHPRRESGETRWHVLLLPGFQRLHEGFAEAGEFPAPEGAGGGGAGQGIRLRGPLAPQLLRHHEGHHGRTVSAFSGRLIPTRPTSFTSATGSW